MIIGSFLPGYYIGCSIVNKETKNMLETNPTNIFSFRIGFILFLVYFVLNCSLYL